MADLQHQLVLLGEILWPDIVISSGATKHLILGVLSVHWEENMEEAQERKRGKYGALEVECRAKGW